MNPAQQSGFTKEERRNGMLYSVYIPCHWYPKGHQSAENKTTSEGKV